MKLSRPKEYIKGFSDDKLWEELEAGLPESSPIPPPK